MKVSVIGAGRVGLSLAAALAEAGHEVLLTDKAREKILDGREPSFEEPGLQALLAKNRQRLQWTADPEAIVRREILLAAVSLPVRAGGDFDLSGLDSWTARAARGARRERQEKLLIIKSALPPGAVRALQRRADSGGRGEGAEAERETKRLLSVVYAPEFLRQGSALQDIRRPSRIVLAGLSASANQKAADFYKSFSKGPILFTSPEEAEIGKLACNSFLALKISFANLTADLQDALQNKEFSPATHRKCSGEKGRGGAPCYGPHLDEPPHSLPAFSGRSAEPKRVAGEAKTEGESKPSGKELKTGGLQEILGSDPRIGKSFLTPGLGFGGPCLPKDLKALSFYGEAAGLSMNLLKEAESLNQERAELFYRWIRLNVQGAQEVFPSAEERPGGAQKTRTGKSRKSAGGQGGFFGCGGALQEDERSALSGKTLAFWGLSFKAGTNDISASPAAALAEKLMRAGARLQIFDPLFKPDKFSESSGISRSLFASLKQESADKKKAIVFCPSPLKAIIGADMLIIGTDDKGFSKIPLKEIKKRLKQPLIADGRAVFNAEELRAEGFVFYQPGAAL